MSDSKTQQVIGENGLDQLKYQLEIRRFRMELAKWIIISVGTVASFIVIDIGKLNLEKEHFQAESRRQLIEAYFSASDSPRPEVWKRKLHILENISNDEATRDWAQGELGFVDEFAEKDALYRETLKVSSQLADRKNLARPDRIAARARFEQLYWADLPYAKESAEVISAMVAFRDSLTAAENAPEDERLWNMVNGHLIALSRTLRDSTPVYQSRKEFGKSRR
jgi:hypothetical protein